MRYLGLFLIICVCCAPIFAYDPWKQLTGNTLPSIGDIINDPPEPVVPNSGQIYFSNYCEEPVKLIVRFRLPNGNWETMGYWNIKGKQSTYLAHEGSNIETDNSVIYYYAESDNGRYVWSGDEYRDFDRKTWPMKKITLSDIGASYTFAINCNNILEIPK